MRRDPSKYPDPTLGQEKLFVLVAYRTARLQNYPMTVCFLGLKQNPKISEGTSMLAQTAETDDIPVVYQSW